MTKLELLSKEKELMDLHLDKLHDLRMQYVAANSEFKVGEYIRSLTGHGIIKIEDIKYNNNLGLISIMYCGYKYVYFKGDLVKESGSEMICLSHNLEKLKML